MKLRTPPGPPRPTSAVPYSVDDETTQPVDAEQMLAAAEQSKHAPDITRPNLVRRSPVDAAVPRPPYARLQVAGSGESMTLHACSISATGMALEIPEGATISVQQGVTVKVEVYDKRRAPVAELLAKVAHVRAPTSGRLGGVSVRWDTSQPASKNAVDRLIHR